MFVPWDLLDSYACQILPLLGSALIINFNLHLVLVSLDRYCCILFPFQYNMPQASVITRWATFAVWLISFASASIPLFTFFVPIPGMCIIQLNSRSFHIYTLSAYIALFYVPIFILGLVHSRILWTVSIHTKRRHEIFALNNSIPTSVLRRNLRAITYMAILIGLFLIFWLPAMIYYAILFPTIHLGISIKQVSIGNILRYISLSYPAINPILHAYFTPCIRSEISRKLARATCKTEHKRNVFV
ncbi:Histamine H2 receptor [Trichoplax sp. H2]|nr:Histamine H2 receptor [Trichoplax sp. H2]|eukprot:RDD45907.1 Histamine H2 receptor [Trichoplax sp. H2]